MTNSQDHEIRQVLLFNFNPDIEQTFEQMQERFESGFLIDGVPTKQLISFRKAFRELIALKKESYKKMVLRYIWVHDSEEWSEKHLRRVWQVTMGGEPWPHDKDH